MLMDVLFERPSGLQELINWDKVEERYQSA